MYTLVRLSVSLIRCGLRRVTAPPLPRLLLLARPACYTVGILAPGFPVLASLWTVCSIIMFPFAAITPPALNSASPLFLSQTQPSLSDRCRTCLCPISLACCTQQGSGLGGNPSLLALLSVLLVFTGNTDTWSKSVQLPLGFQPLALRVLFSFSVSRSVGRHSRGLGGLHCLYGIFLFPPSSSRGFPSNFALLPKPLSPDVQIYLWLPNKMRKHAYPNLIPFAPRTFLHSHVL